MDLSLVGIHYPNYPYTPGEEAKAIWEIDIYENEENENCRIIEIGDREEVLQIWQPYIDRRIDNPMF
ncbi:hypothetical protein QUA51_09825 [Microcoleus sp. Pol10_D6]|uniref:hypothetical protein n=1 Tax=unclassified Microcoleus TaxID=2642155 RepID=UPI002FD3452B